MILTKEVILRVNGSRRAKKEIRRYAIRDKSSPLGAPTCACDVINKITVDHHS